MYVISTNNRSNIYYYYTYANLTVSLVINITNATLSVGIMKIWVDIFYNASADVVLSLSSHCKYVYSRQSYTSIHLNITQYINLVQIFTCNWCLWTVFRTRCVCYILYSILCCALVGTYENVIQYIIQTSSRQ